MSQHPQVIITDFIADDLAPERQILGDVADVVALDAYCEDELIGRIESAAAILLYHNLGLSERTISRLTDCKLIVRCGVGVDNVDWRYARTRGINVANIPDYGTEEVADSAIGFALALSRGIALQNSLLRTPPAETSAGHAAAAPPWMYVNASPIHRLRGKQFGIIGLGRIGTATALRAKALGMQVAFYDPYVVDGIDKSLGVRRCETLAELVAHTHILSVHCPLTSETRNLLDGAAMAALPRGSFVINTARGAIVQTQAIPELIASGHLAGVGIDVLPHEPPPVDDVLVAAWRNPRHPAHQRVLINPHSAFYSEEGLMDMRSKGAENCRRALLGQRVRNIIN